LAASLYSPSYISFETVLRSEGIIFSALRHNFAAGPWPKTVKINNNTFTFRKLKDEIYSTRPESARKKIIALLRRKGRF